MNDLGHLIPVIERLDSAVVACAGDIILDHFVYGDVSRISPEAPIPVMRISSQASMLGGVGNVVRNLGALGCSVRLFSITGDDNAGLQIASMLGEVPSCKSHVMAEQSRQTSEKMRYVAHSQQLLRADRETTQDVSDEMFQKVLRTFEEEVSGCTVVCLSDYAKGMFNGSRVREFIGIARAAGKSVIVDPKGRDFSRYSHATLIKPNLKELSEATGMPVNGMSAQIAAARQLLEITAAEMILVTRGSGGMLLLSHDQSPLEFPALAREVYDVSGAGDTVAAVLAGAVGSGANFSEAVDLANIAAGIVVGKIGTAVVERDEIIHEIELRSTQVIGQKLLRHSELLQRIAMWKKRGLRIGLVHGLFDVLSAQHITVLEQMRSRCDRLVVALQSDTSYSSDPLSFVRTQHERAFVLSALLQVDAVVMFDEATPQRIIEEMRPDVVTGDNTPPVRVLDQGRGVRSPVDVPL